VRAFLLGQSLELFLKTYLLHLDLRMSTAELRRLGHNLERLLTACEEGGLDAVTPISAGIRADMTILSSAYASKALQYFSLLYLLVPPQLPELRRLLRFAKALDVSLVRLVGAA
jgi:HEPN domain-containing protein